MRENRIVIVTSQDKNSLKECVFVNSVLKIQNTKLSKIHSYSLLFRRFCPELIEFI